MDVPKHNAARSYQSTDGRTSCDVADCATSWSVGAEMDPQISMNESEELDQKHGIVRESLLPSATSGNVGSNVTLPNPHNKRGPSTEKQGAFDSANLDGDDLNQSYADDPPISGAVGGPFAGGSSLASRPGSPIRTSGSGRSL